MAGFKITLNGVDITNKIGGRLVEIFFEDEMMDISDALSMTINDPDMEFSKLFKKNSKLEVEFEETPIVQEYKESAKNRRKISTSKMFIDEVNYSLDEPSYVIVRALPNTLRFNALRKEYFCSYPNISLRKLLRNALSTIGYGKKEFYFVYRKGTKFLREIQLKNVIHRPIQIISMLTAYARRFECFVKVTEDNILFASKEYFNKQPAVMRFVPKFMQNGDCSAFWSFRNKDNYEVVKAKQLLYYDPNTYQIKKAPKKILAGEVPEDLVKIVNTKKMSEEDAQMLINSVENQFERTLYINTIIDARLKAGNVVEVANMPNYNGRYLIKSAHYYFNKRNNYVQLELLLLENK